MKKILLLVFVSFSFALFAQIQSLQLDQLMTDRTLYPQTLPQLQWLNKTAVIYQKQNTIEVIDVIEKTKKTLFSLEDLNKAMLASNFEELAALPRFTVRSNFLTFIANYRWVQFDPITLKAELLSSIPDYAKNVEVYYPAKQLTYTRESELILLTQNIKLRVAIGEQEGIKNGVSVHRNEFGIDKGVFFSPDGRYLAYYTMDESMVTNYPLVDVNTRIAMVKNNRYPMAGMRSHNVRIGVFDVTTFNGSLLKSTFDRESYSTNVAWSPDSKAIYVAMVSRDQKTMRLRQYDPINGHYVKELFEEKSSCYVEPTTPMVFVPGNPDFFVWQSQRDGYNHLYLYNTEGKMIRQITQGSWVVKELIGFSPKGDKVYFTATKDSPLETHLYVTSVSKSSDIDRITQAPGIHTVSMNSEGSSFIDQYSNLETPYTAQVINLKGKTIEVLSKSENPLKNYTVGTTILDTLKAADGKTDLYARMIKPHNFDQNKKYPVIIYVYGGPHSQLVTNSWLGGGNLFMNYLAQQGYIVWTLDNRGTSHRGFEFESVTHRQLGTHETADQMEGVKYLKSLPFVDSTRIGVDGWSYGGFMAISLKLRYPGVFKVATAGGPVIDWKWYEVMYGERYMETPEENPEGYKTANLLNYVDNLEGKLLVIHGAQDNTVVWQHSLAFIAECINKNKQVDYFVYPNHEHNVGGVQRTHLFQKLYDYYRENL